MSLFKRRGWTTLIADGLADGVMFMMKISIALITGLYGYWLVNHDDDIFVGIGIDAKDDNTFGFFISALIGYVVSSIIMELVGSSICAVIVCFAQSPDVFYRNRPQLCKEMLDAWKAAYPDETADDFDSVKA